MAGEYNTSVNQTKNKSYNYDPQVTLKAGVSYDEMGDVFNYSEIYDNANAETNNEVTKNIQEGSSAKNVWGITMGQTQNFTFAISDINNADSAFSLSCRNGMFLPLKSLDYKPITLDHFKIKAGIFSELPFFHRRKLGAINCVMLDSHKSYISQALYKWYNSCVVTNRSYVPYVDEMCKHAEYIEYTHDGKFAVKYSFSVMPDGDFSTNRTYEGDGALTEYKFSLLIVSDIQMISNGKAVNNSWTEADWGNGTGQRADYERRVSGVAFNYDGKGNNASINDPAIIDHLR